MQFSNSAFVVALLASTASSVSADCSCDVDDSSSKTFKCGNDIYVCPGVDRICSTQASKNSVYYDINQDQCDGMQAVALNQDCVPLPEHGITKPKALSNRVCYDDDATSAGFKGMKDDGNCGFCQNVITPPITVQTNPPQEASTDAPEEIVVPNAPKHNEPLPNEPTTNDDSDCSCGVSDPTAETFKCGNEIYVCPGVERICSTQDSQNSIYYSITQAQCDVMKDVAIGEKCVTLDHHGTGSTGSKGLSNRVCYDKTDNGFHGMKEDGSCGVCKDSITAPPVSVETIPPQYAETESPTDGTNAPQELVVPACPEDITVLKQFGVTVPPENAGISIVSQDTSTVTVALNQAWTDANDSLDFVYYKYKTSLFNSKCYGIENVTGGDFTYDTATITCNILKPIAVLEICVVDNVLEGNAEVPKCCHSVSPPETSTVCYMIEINCDTECADPGTTRKLLRGSR